MAYTHYVSSSKRSTVAVGESHVLKSHECMIATLIFSDRSTFVDVGNQNIANVDCTYQS